ncbi:porin [Halomonas sp. MCCC 1A11036]|uniref:Porin n=1 Tax=Billgrantia zhangzhouensis TaxID=2733481 RepID=A0ABS9AFM1_9GAMM|nr:porin [Halomonas zhangzhouensis]MCE8020500.1 porin [Halomonas zhangzhouensis]
MKKTLLATAIAGALGASAAAQAATVYDQDGTRLDIYGRIAMGIAGGGPEYDSNNNYERNSAEFVDVFSRLGLRMSHEVSSDLTAFGHVEWRFRGDERTGGGRTSDTDFSGFSETRQSYIGLRSNTFGTFQAGNFDAFYKDAVTAPFDVYIDQGLEFQGHPIQSRGDSIGYITPDLSGFQAFLQAKHYSSRGTNPSEPGQEDNSEIATQGGVKYELEGLRLALGYVDDRDGRAGGSGEMIWGATASYAFNDNFSARLGYETRGNNDDQLAAGGNAADYAGFDTWGLGMTYALGQWAFNADVYRISVDNEDPDNGWDDRTAWALGSYYKLSNNFDVFAELFQGDQPDVTIGSGGIDTADGDDMYYLVGARYHF